MVRSAVGEVERQQILCFAQRG